MKIEKLKAVDLEKLEQDKVIEHRKEVLSMERQDVVEYLKYSIEKYYDMEYEKNNKSVLLFFQDSSFQDYYGLILDEWK